MQILQERLRAALLLDSAFEDILMREPAGWVVVRWQLGGQAEKARVLGTREDGVERLGEVKMELVEAD